MPSGDPLQHPSTWGNPRAEQVLRRLARMDVPEVSARTMRKRLRGIPAAVPPIGVVTGTRPLVRQDAPRLTPRQRSAQFADPRDWRWFVGGLGKVLISIGILIFAFVAYQLWGTGIQYARAQDQLENEFDEQLAALSQATTAPGPVSTLAQVPGPDETTTTVPATTVVDPTVAPPPSDTPVELPPLSLGDVLGRIEIPSIGVSDMIVAGVRQTDLDKGVGHYPYTPLPGNTGNAAIAGHRTTHGQPFFDLDKLKPGDQIVVTTLEGRFVYLVDSSKVVDPSDFTVLLGTPAESRLTLTTCHPRYSQKKRLVVSAVLDPELSKNGNADVSYSAEAVAGGSTSESDSGDDAGTVDTIAGGATTDTLPGTDAPAASSSAEEATADAFAQGWFHDKKAWPQIALWGFGLTAVALAATFLGRRSRNWIGAIVGIAPFVVLLYFWFENVNRLLPPGL